MKEQLILFDTAKLAKEKGFDLPSEFFYIEGEEELNQLYRDWDNPNINSKGKYSIRVITQSLLETWLFEEHNIRIEITFDDAMWMIYVGEFSFPDSSVDFVGTVECEGFKDSKNKRVEAIEKGLQEALKLI